MSEVEYSKEKEIKLIWDKSIKALHFVVGDASIDEVEVYD
jgi:hypothetical protein